MPVDAKFPGNLVHPIQQPAMIGHCAIPKWLDLRMGGNVCFFQRWFDSLSTPQYTQTQ
jgi:hypothetical protein